MRNLKRALSLALASVMLLGMMVVGTSAASYTDVDEKDNVEAIEVLNAVNVMIGRQGNFEPDEPVNRHEMAVIMAKLYLGVETADNYVGTHPFTDVVPWADKYVAACYENGLVAGTSSTTFSGSKDLTAVEAAAMMLRALGYKDLNKGYQGDWRAPITATANQIRLFSGVASNPSEKLDRNQVAQLALNTLKSPMVNLIDGTFDISNGEGNIIITGGAREYKVIASKESYAYAINDVESEGNSASGINGATVELGEHLYNGKLRLTSTTDAFQRPARQWEYDGKQIGTYVKDELLRQVWTEKVTGKMIYDVLTKSVIEGSNKYDFTIAVDGVLNTNKTALGTAYFDEGYLNSNHKSAVGGTGNGVTTEVYVDSGNKQVYISVINTYLAKATGDYNATRETATYNVYGLDNKGNSANPVFVKTLTAAEDKETVTVSADDFNIAGVKKDDIILVNVADGTIQIMEEPEVMASASLSAFAKNDYVVSGGSTIKYNNAAEYDFETLDKFTGISGATNLRDKHYNLYLDKNGYLAGIEAVEEDNNYIFLTGIDAGLSDLTNKTADAAGILMDGTFVSMKVNMEKSKLADGTTAFSGNSMWNTWCTYSVDNSGVYTLKQVGADPTATGSGKVAQVHSPSYVTSDTQGKDINIKNYSLPGSGVASYNFVYGNENSVYMTAKMKVISAKEDVNGYVKSLNTTDYTTAPVAQDIDSKDKVAIISGVDTRTVGIANTDMTTWYGTQIYNKFTTKPVAGDNGNAGEYLMPSGVYTLYNNKGYVVASIVIGEDNGIATNLVLVNSKDIKEERFEANAAKATDGEWVWSREVIDLNNGEVTKIYEKGDTPSEIDNVSLPQWTVAQIKLNGDNYVTGANKGNAITGAAYEDDITRLETTISGSNKDLVAFKSTAIGVEPWFNGNTLHVNYGASEGVPVHPDVKTVLLKTTDGASETTEFSGSNELDTVLATLNKDKDTGKVSFEITALIKGGRAITIVVRDLNETGGQINEKPDDNDNKNMIDGVYVDLSDRADVKVYTEKFQLSVSDAMSAIMAVLENTYGAGKVKVEEDESTANTFHFTAPTGMKYTFDSDGTGKIVVAAVEYTLDGEPALGTAGGTYDVAANTFARSSTDGGKTWTWVSSAGTDITLAAGIEIETGYVKLSITTGSGDDLANVIKSGSDYYAKGDTVVNKASGKKGSGYTAGSDFYKYGTYTFAQVDGLDGSADGTAAFAAVAQWALTYYTAADVATVKGVADGSVTLTNTEVPGTHFYKDRVSGTPLDKATTANLTFNVNGDITIYGNYVKTGKATVAGDAGPVGKVSVSWDNDLASEPIMKMGTKITATVTFAKPALGADMTIKASGGDAYSCDATGLKNTPNDDTKWDDTDTYTAKAADNGKMEGTIKITFELGATTAKATPTLTVAGGE